MVPPPVRPSTTLVGRAQEELERSFTLVDDLRGAAGLITLPTDRVDAAFLDEAGPSLRVVAQHGVGYDNVDVAAANERGVVVTNTPDVLTGAVAELTLGLILALVRRIAEGDRLIRRGDEWRFGPAFLLGRSLAGRKLGIVGYGRIGREAGRLAEAFGMRVAGAGRSTDLLDFLPGSDVVSLHVPLTGETVGLIGEAELRAMKPTAVLVNTTRGPVVDEEALVRALEGGELAGAALDVFEREPEVHPGLVGREDVVLTPHIGSATFEAREGMGLLCVEALRAVLLEDRVPANALNPGAWRRG